VTTGEQLLTETSAVGFRVAPMEASPRAEVDEANGLMPVRGVPATVLDTRDANGRIHPRESFERALKKEGAFASRSLLCTADDHPEQSYPRPAKASHIVIDARIEPGEGGGSPRVVNDWLVLNSIRPAGAALHVEG
jgi:hypothetical protein